MVWHHNHGWLHPRKYIEAAKADVEAGEITREEVADALGFYVAELDAENARDRARQDQMSPGTWTTLPEGIDLDDWMFDITDPEPTTAAIDVQCKHGRVRIDLNVGGKTTTVEADPEGAARLLRELRFAERNF
jgi:peptidoglycan/xylan/chitin deacetylase (PgdA/CDA1 family)